MTIRNNTLYIQTLYIPTNLLFVIHYQRKTLSLSPRRLIIRQRSFSNKTPAISQKLNRIYIKNFLTSCYHQCPTSDWQFLSAHWIVVFVKKIANIYLANTNPINNFYYTIIIYFLLADNTYIIYFIRNSIYK